MNIKTINLGVALLTFSFLFVALTITAQELPLKPVSIKKAAFFDKTPELRHMKVILPGERDRSWKDNIVANTTEKPGGLSESNRTAVTQNVQREMGTKTHRSPIRNFDGVNNRNGVAPPDTDGEVGPDHFFQIVNSSFTIYSKTGELLYGPVDNSTLWDEFVGPWTGTNDGDPVVLYDHMDDRWIATQFAVNTSNGKYYELIAVSETGDPLGAYYRYAFEYDIMNDYPKLSVWTDAYLCTFNMFGSQGFEGALVSAFDREKMLIGDPDAQSVDFGYLDMFSLVSSDIDGPIPPVGTPGYVMGFKDGSLDIYQVDLDWDDLNNSTFTLNSTVNVSSFNSYFPDKIAQPNNTSLDPLSSMIMFRLQYRNFGTYESMVSNHTVNVGGNAGIRWYELRKTADVWTLYQEGTYAPDDENRWMGSIAQNAKGTIAIGYSVSSSTTHPSIRYAGRTIDAPLGTFNLAEGEILDGTVSQSGVDRWGDYSCLTVDPVNDSIFWFTTEYTKGGWNWRTRIASFDFNPPLAPSLTLVEYDSICNSEVYNCAPDASYIASHEWTTSGDGTFYNSNALFTSYIRGMDDYTSGEVWLKISAIGYDGTEVIDSVHVALLPSPESNAGPNQTVAEWGFANLEGTSDNYSSIEWSTDGDGVFDDASQLQTVYTPGDNDRIEGSAKLRLKAIGVAPCNKEFSDYVTISLDETLSNEMEEKVEQKMTISPNPTQNLFTIALSGVDNGPANLQIYDQQGMRIFGQKISIESNSYQNRFDISGFAAGVYIVKVFTQGGIVVDKIVKQ